MYVVQVLGLNNQFNGLADKVEAFHAFLFGSAVNMLDDDLFVFFDAYDVFLLPEIAKVDEFMSKAETPIVFCAEKGFYFEFSGT